MLEGGQTADPESLAIVVGKVDASDDSRPIPERLGFVSVTRTTPHNWSPPV